VNVTGLLLFMLGATEAAKGPEVAPDGIVMVMDLSLQELIVVTSALVTLFDIVKVRHFSLWNGTCWLRSTKK